MLVKSSQVRNPLQCCIIPIILVTVTSAAQGKRLRSPWDGLAVKPTEAVYNCPAPPPFAKTLEIGSYYIDSHASIADPQKLAAFQKASEASTHLSQFAALAADAYRDKGSRPAAVCVYSLLDAAAKAHAWAGKMPSFQGVYVQNWLLSAVAISYLKVRESGAGTVRQDARIQKWFKALTGRIEDYFGRGLKRGDGDARNNHLYWAGLAIAAASIACDRHKDFEAGILTYRIGVSAIQPDGSLVAEMARAQMALHYHLYALGPLIIMAELGEANGLDLYAEENGAIHSLVNFCVAGLEAPSLLEKRTGVAQVVTLPYAGSDIGWAVPYVRRFPNPQLSELLAKAPWVRYTSWGGAPPD
jgi:poly(beta-D-mannuronate) lyase